ncbi:MAG: hypothetical protein ABUL49_01340, partial [bacterium]
MAEKTAAAKTEYDNSETGAEGAKQSQDKASEALKGAEEAAATAKDALIKAQKAEDDATSAFAHSRPLAISERTESDDPVRRVDIFAMEDREGLFVRGAQSDVQTVEALISSYDEPAPQARLSIFELQVNVAQDNPGRKTYLKVQSDVLAQLQRLRSDSVSSSKAFLDAVSKEANAPGDSASTKFYNSASQKVLGDEAPDPRQFSTFGESIIFYLLANADIQKKVLADFKAAIDADTTTSDKTSRHKDMVSKTSAQKFTRFLEELRPRDAGSLSPLQSEVIRGIAATKLKALAKKIGSRWSATRHSLLDVIAGRVKDSPIYGLLRESQVTDEAKARFKSLTSEELVRMAIEDVNNQKLLVDFYAGAISTLNNHLEHKEVFQMHAKLLTYFEFVSGVKARTRNDFDLILQDNFGDAISEGQAFSARIAAGDSVVKQVILAFEDDLNETYLRKGFQDLQEIVHGTGVSFGQLKKTSMLVTNRQFGSVIASAAADVSPAKSVDALGELNEALGILAASQGQNLTSIVGQLNDSEKKKPVKPSEIYGITSSGTFRVTPAFEATGQAMRFRFEYSTSTDVAEPNGTVNGKVPLVSRHSVNNEFQIGNFEIREVSSFGVNSQLGLPTRKTGGLPLLKDIPVINQIPLIGWFNWRGGRSAVAQESIIFAQTTIYPTLGDLFKLVGN